MDSVFDLSFIGNKELTARKISEVLEGFLLKINYIWRSLYIGAQHMGLAAHFLRRVYNIDNLFSGKSVIIIGGLNQLHPSLRESDSFIWSRWDRWEILLKWVKHCFDNQKRIFISLWLWDKKEMIKHVFENFYILWECYC